MRLWCVSLCILSCPRFRPRAFENDGGGALVVFRVRCRLKDWWSGGDDVDGEWIGVWWGNVSAPGMGWIGLSVNVFCKEPH